MKDIRYKTETAREAIATGCVTMAPATIKRLLANDVPKKDVLILARVAAVMAAKKTPDIIPYCHPLLIDSVDVSYETGETSVTITTKVSTIAKTGVEMEALHAVSAATLTIYDMLKPIDKNMEINGIKLVSKSGGKSDFVEHLPKDFKAVVIVSSDSTFKGTREDKSGKIIGKIFDEMGIENYGYIILPDEKEQIRETLVTLSDQGVHLIVTTGGTGLGPRDVTVEATGAIIERELPAVSQAIFSYGQKRTPYAMLSRGLAGVRKNTVIVNLPGSSRGAEEGMRAVFPALLHIYKMMRGGSH